MLRVVFRLAFATFLLLASQPLPRNDPLSQNLVLPNDVLAPVSDHGDEARDNDGDVHHTAEHLQHNERARHRRSGCNIAQSDSGEGAEAKEKQFQP